MARTSGATAPAGSSPTAAERASADAFEMINEREAVIRMRVGYTLGALAMASAFAGNSLGAARASTTVLMAAGGAMLYRMGVDKQ